MSEADNPQGAAVLAADEAWWPTIKRWHAQAPTDAPAQTLLCSICQDRELLVPGVTTGRGGGKAQGGDGDGDSDGDATDALAKGPRHEAAALCLCGHVFGAACLRAWMAAQNGRDEPASCPLCRHRPRFSGDADGGDDCGHVAVVGLMPARLAPPDVPATLGEEPAPAAAGRWRRCKYCDIADAIGAVMGVMGARYGPMWESPRRLQSLRLGMGALLLELGRRDRPSWGTCSLWEFESLWTVPGAWLEIDPAGEI